MIRNILRKKALVTQPMASYCSFSELQKRQAKRRLQMTTAVIPIHPKGRDSTFLCGSK